MDKEKRNAGLGGVIKNLFRRLWVILIFAAICGGAMYAVSTYLVEPKYESDVRLYINGGETSDDLVDVCGAVLRSQSVLEEIIAESGVKYTYKELDKMVSYRDVNSTNMIEITVKSADPEEAAAIADVIAYVLPGKAEDVIYESKVSVLQYATVQTEPSSPSIGKYTLAGMLAGIILGCLITTWVYLLDDAIKDKDYLERTFGIPVLAYIPEYKPEKTETDENKDDNK